MIKIKIFLTLLVIAGSISLRAAAANEDTENTGVNKKEKTQLLEKCLDQTNKAPGQLHKTKISYFATVTGNHSDVLIEAEKKKLDKGQVIFSMQQNNGHNWVVAKIRINAQQRIVWDAIHQERQSDPDISYSKIIKKNDNQYIMEQKFVLIPIFGSSTCVIKDIETPQQCIDYWLVKSDRFKALEGRWNLVPTGDNKGTFLELSSYLDIGLPIPQAIVEGMTEKKMERRLQNVRKMAEHVQPHIIAQGQNQSVIEP